MRLNLIFGTLAVAMGCSGYQQSVRQENVVRMDGELRKRAAFDLSCAEDKLALTPLGDSTRGVEGCGQKATYIYANMSWVMNTINGTVAPQTASNSKGTTP